MELFTYTFIQYAFIGGVCMALVAGLLGPFVVQSRQSIASDMFAHVALAGIGAAVLFGSSPWWGALPALISISTILWWLSIRGNYSPDALAMFFLSGGLAAALAFVHMARDSVFSFENYLFGSILTLTTVDIYTIIATTAVVSILTLLFWYPLLGATSQPRYILPFRRTPQLVLLMYFWLLALVVWIGIKTIGGLLIGALLVIPVLSARAWAQSFYGITIITTLVAVSSVLGGLLLALYVDLPPSSLIIGTLIGIFGLQLALQKLPSFSRRAG